MCFNKANASTSTSDQRVGADNGAASFGAGSNYGDITLSSDDTAQMAIESSVNALTETYDFLGPTLTNFFNLTDKRLERADENSSTTQQFASELLLQQGQTADDRLIKVLLWGGGAIVVVVALQSGIVKDIVGGFK